MRGAVALAWMPSGAQIVTGSEDKLVKVHDRPPPYLPYKVDTSRPSLCTNWTRLEVWDVASGEELLSLAGHAGWVHAVAVSPDGHRAASAAADQLVKLWGLDEVPPPPSPPVQSGHVSSIPPY